MRRGQAREEGCGGVAILDVAYYDGGYHLFPETTKAIYVLQLEMAAGYGKLKKLFLSSHFFFPLTS